MNLISFRNWAACGLVVLLSVVVATSRADRAAAAVDHVARGRSPNPPLPFGCQPFKHLTIPCPSAWLTSRERNRSLWRGAFLPRVGRSAHPDNPEMKETQLLLDFDVLASGSTFHPDYVRNGYLLYVGSDGPIGFQQENHARHPLHGAATNGRLAIVPGSAKLIIEWLSDGHNGGDVAFGLDGMLYVTSGDGTSDSDMNFVGQDLSKLNSKVLRIDVDHPDAGLAYGIPKDNPFVGKKGVGPETWAYGLRNPWRIRDRSADRRHLGRQQWTGSVGASRISIARRAPTMAGA